MLIVGAPGTGKTLLFRALAGLWPWGSGQVIHPKDEQMLYLPRGTPYLPRGTLREVLAYPLEGRQVSPIRRLRTSSSGSDWSASCPCWM